MNKIRAKALLVIVALAATFNVNAQLNCSTLDGAKVWSQESNPVYLGFFGTAYATDSIMNLYGTYGNQYNPLSVRNQYGNYGSPYNPYSATNDYTSTPPVIRKGGAAIGFLTSNQIKAPGVSLGAIDSTCAFYSSAPAPNDPQPPPPPSGVEASDGTYSDKIVVSWNTVSTATAYNVYYSEASSSTKNIIGQTSGTSMTITAGPGITYYFWVFSVNEHGESSTGSYDTGYAKAAPSVTVPNAPTISSAEPGDRKVILRFAANGDGGSSITGYTATCGAFNQSGPSSPITVSGLTNGINYACSVVATNAIGTSEPSSSIHVTPSTEMTSTFQINTGLNDAWFDPNTNGQGFFITALPQLGVVVLAWFTYDIDLPAEGETAALGDPGHRWLTASGPFAGNQAVLSITSTSGGIFDAPSDVQRTDDGTIVLTFDNCNSGTAEYDISSINQQGVIQIQRVAGDNIGLCESFESE